jgi:hypothetical protein
MLHAGIWADRASEPTYLPAGMKGTCPDRPTPPLACASARRRRIPRPRRPRRDTRPGAAHPPRRNRSAPVRHPRAATTRGDRERHEHSGQRASARATGEPARKPPISHDRCRHCHPQPWPLHARQESPETALRAGPAGPHADSMANATKAEGRSVLPGQPAPATQVPALADPGQRRLLRRGNRIRTGVQPAGCCTLLLYKPLDLGSGFRIVPLTCGAMRIRTPDLLHAMHTPAVARCGWTSPCVALTCGFRGWTWPSVAWCLSTLAPHLAPGTVVSAAKVR